MFSSQLALLGVLRSLLGPLQVPMKPMSFEIMRVDMAGRGS
jgi:hypothetical protein